MFGLKWLWKSNKGSSSIDTSNFVSKEFFSTTLQDYVNRDLFNTTLSDYITTTSLNNTLSTFASKEYVSDELSAYMNRTEIGINLVQYVKKTALNTTLADYVQTSSLNTTLSNYITTNTEQTITSLKTFNAGPVGIKLKQAAGRVDKQYLIFANKDNTTTFSLGSQLSETSFEANRGNIKFQTQEANKSVIFNTPLVEFNRSVPQFGQNITAGWGGGVCKFLPEDNSTKTLQFYLNNANDTRRFKLLIGEPTEANNPATKQYVDNQINTINNQPLVQKRDYTFSQIRDPENIYDDTQQYTFEITDLQETTVLGVNVNFKDQANAALKAKLWNVSFTTTWGPKVYVKLSMNWNLHLNYTRSEINIDFSKFAIRVFYIPQYNQR